MAHLAEAMAGRKGVVFDTSTWSPIDLLDFYRQVPPEQVVYASDYPYGQYTSSLYIALRTAILAGYDERAAAADARRDGRPRSPTATELPEPTTPLGPETYRQPMQLARIHQYLSMATPLLWTSQAGHGRRARARDQHVRRAQRLRRRGRPHPRAARGGARPVGRPGATAAPAATAPTPAGSRFRLIHLADIEAVTAPA